VHFLIRAYPRHPRFFGFFSVAFVPPSSITAVAIKNPRTNPIFDATPSLAGGYDETKAISVAHVRIVT
jgi:hypothetical protein